MTLEAVVFDLDGTLVDSLRDIADSLNEVLQSLDRPTYSNDVIRRMVGGGVRALLERALGSDADTLMPLARRRFAPIYERRLLAHTRPYPGISSLLVALRRKGVRIGVATNKPAAYTGPLVRRLGIASVVHGVASADEVARKKPDPLVLQLALARMTDRTIPPERVAYVGDMPVDVHTARAHGALAVGVGYGFDPEGTQRSGPDVYAATGAALHASLLERAG